MLTAGKIGPCPCSDGVEDFSCRMSRAELRDPETGVDWVGIGRSRIQALQMSFFYHNHRTHS